MPERLLPQELASLLYRGKGRTAKAAFCLPSLDHVKWEIQIGCAPKVKARREARTN